MYIVHIFMHLHLICMKMYIWIFLLKIDNIKIEFKYSNKKKYFNRMGKEIKMFV